MKKKSRQEIIYEVALAGISAALALLLVWLSVVVRYGTIGFYAAACIAVLVPLTNRYYFATICAYVVSALLAFAIVGDIFTIAGYVVYFAPISIVSAIMLEKKVKWYISIPVKVVYINLALAFLYFVAGTIMINAEAIGKVPYYLVAIVGTVILLAIDFIISYAYKSMKPIISKALRKGLKDDEIAQNDDECTENDVEVFDMENDVEQGTENSDAETANEIAENANEIAENADENSDEIDDGE